MLGDLVEGRREACLTSARSIAGRHLLRPPRTGQTTPQPWTGRRSGF